jgi:hypothetical protein
MIELGERSSAALRDRVINSSACRRLSIGERVAECDSFGHATW